jgi:hypothetical protein
MDTVLAEGTRHEMPDRVNDPFVIPDTFWQRPDVTEALRIRKMGRFFELVQQYTGASQTQIGIAIGWSQPKVSDLERGVSEVRHLAVFEDIADGLKFPDPARILLGLAPRALRPQLAASQPHQVILQGDARPVLQPRNLSGLLGLDSEDEQQEDDDLVRRRTLVGLTGTAILDAVLGDRTSDPPAVNAEPFAHVLAAPSSSTLGETPGLLPDVSLLSTSVDNAWHQYSAGRYSDLTKTLPALLARLHAASSALHGEAPSRVFALCADAHRVAALLLFKLDDQGLAYLAADRCMRAAEASGDPVTVGAAATTIAYTLVGGGHFGTAITAARTYAERLDHDMFKHTPDSLSVYGNVLLHGAEAAAMAGKRDTAIELLGEVDEAARRLGFDGNLRRTSFGPTNVKLWRVALAVTLGDAGSAVDTARKTDFDAITTSERKAAFLVDTARAFLLWGKHDKAYAALRAAEETAHEEVAGRPTVHRVIRDLASSAPPSMRREIGQFAIQIGVVQ